VSKKSSLPRRAFGFVGLILGTFVVLTLAKGFVGRQAPAARPGPIELQIKLYTDTKQAEELMIFPTAPGVVVGVCLDAKDRQKLLGNWIECDGSEFLCDQYPDLAKILAPGRSPNEKFRVPDLRGMATSIPIHPSDTDIARTLMTVSFVNGLTVDPRREVGREIRWLVYGRK
jgi:tail collar domain